MTLSLVVDISLVDDASLVVDIFQERHLDSHKTTEEERQKFVDVCSFINNIGNPLSLILLTKPYKTYIAIKSFN